MPATRINPTFFWLLIFAINLMMVLPFTRIEYPLVDTAEAIYHAKLLVLGRIPYKEIFSHHFLGYLAPYVFVEKILGFTPLVLWGLTICVNFINAVLVFLILAKISSLHAARIGAALIATIGWFPQWQGFSLNVQATLMPYNYAFILALVCADKSRSSRWLGGAGILFGVMICADIREVFFGLAALPLLLSERNQILKKTITFVSSAALVPGVALAYLWSHDALGDWYFQTILYPFLFRNKGISAPASTLWELYSTGAMRQLPEVLLALCATVLVWKSNCPPAYRALLLCLLVAGLCASAIGGRAFYNYLLFLGPWILLSVASSVGDTGGTHVSQRLLRLAPVAVISLTLIGGPIRIWVETGELRPSGSYNLPARTAGRFIERHTTPESSILVWGYYPQLYLYSNRFSRFRALEQLSFTGGNFESRKFSQQGIVPAMTQNFKSCLLEFPPQYIVRYKVRSTEPFKNCSTGGRATPNLDYERIPHLAYFRKFVRDNYRLVRNYSYRCEVVRIYALNPESELRPKIAPLQQICASPMKLASR
ncbi:MAG: glycosyltransferase family 39 protein [Deltaproteobacteria bacterium]|nr:glycosyltransferase family 39 protein [Deltaproteobacteria bacterium]